MNKNKLLHLVIDKWPVKVLSLAAALIISIFYRMSTLETRFFTVPLRIESNDIFTPVNFLVTGVRISVRGEAEGIQTILEDDIEVYIDLSRYTSEGSYRAPVHIRKKGSALGIEPLEISVLPIEIPVILELRIRQSIPVFPVFRGTPAEGYELTNQMIIPDRVTVEGPRSAISEIIGFNTETIDLDRRFEDFTTRVNILDSDPLVTIHGDRMIEYRGTIRAIPRELPEEEPEPDDEVQPEEEPEEEDENENGDNEQ